MNKEDIIRMAREAKTLESPFGAPKWGVPSWSFDADELERFAALVAAAATASEREACAEVVDANARQCGIAVRLILESNAAAIRARGNI